MTARDVVRKLLSLGAVELRQKGSHRRFASPCGRCKTVVQEHGSKDIPRGTLGGIQRDMEPCFGKGWLLG